VSAGLIPGSRASLMLDVVALAMLLVLPALTANLHLARRRRRYDLHKRGQLALGLALLVVVLLFEIDVRLHDWTALAEPSPYYGTWLFPFLYMHIALASLTTALWITTTMHALRRFPAPPRPGPASSAHRRLGYATAACTYATAVTGWIFYWAAFLA
jgi:uncharacterized membrane protein YozB (DUF420 family)